MLMSIRAKLSLALILTALLSVLITTAVAVRLLENASEQNALVELRQQARSLAGEGALLRRDPKLQTRFLRRSLNLSGASILELTTSGELRKVAGESEIQLNAEEITKLSRGAEVFGVRAKLFAAQPVERGPRSLVVLLERPPPLAFLPGSRGSFLTAALIATGAAAFVAFFLARRIGAPLKELAFASADVARGRFDRRVEVSTNDEVGVVANAFNEMAQALGDSNQRQREFFMSVSHELRTPLTSIQAYAEAIEDGVATGSKGREAAAVIGAESKRLSRLVSDLLDLARLDAGRFSVECESVSMAEVSEKVRRNFSRQAADAGVTLKVTSGAETAHADEDRLVQVLGNLVENALRYTPSGGRIDLTVKNSDGKCVVEVTDTGPGFTQADLPHAFDREYLYGKYKGVRNVGTGLGLAITKELASAMGGSVSAMSRDGAGASFKVTLPAV